MKIISIQEATSKIASNISPKNIGTLIQYLTCHIGHSQPLIDEINKKNGTSLRIMYISKLLLISLNLR